MAQKVNSRLTELTERAKQATADLNAACTSDDIKLVAALHEARTVEAGFSAYLADLKYCLNKSVPDGFCSFRLHNVPQWPAARVKAWLVRNKLAVKDLEKKPSWTHAILTVPEASAPALKQTLNNKAIQGKFLTVCDITAATVQREVLPGPPSALPPPPPADSNGQRCKVEPALKVESGFKVEPSLKVEPGIQDGSKGSAVNDAEVSPVLCTPQSPVQHSDVLDEKLDPVVPQDSKSADIRDSLCPLWRQPYSEQLKLKQEQCYSALCRLTAELAMCITQTRKPDWLQNAIEAETVHGSAAGCPVQNILRSPQTNAYRNKADFSIGFDGDHKPRAGHFYGLFRNGWSQVGAVETIPQLSATAKGYAELMTRFLNSDKCNLPAWNKDAKAGDTAAERGFWRAMTVREGRNAVWLPPAGPDEVVHSRDSDPSWQSLQVERFRVPFVKKAADANAHASLRWHLPADAAAACDVPQADAPDADELVVCVMVNMTCGDGDATAAHADLKAWAKFVETERPAGLPAPTSMCYQHSELLGNGAPPNEPVRVLPGWPGTAVGYHDTMCGTRFAVHPLAFFQVNTAAATLVYKLVQTLAVPATSEQQKDTCVLDICCGTGTIGMVLAPHVAHVVGIDNSVQNIESAKANAVANGADNMSFVHGAAEKMIDMVLEKDSVAKASQVVAVVDPPRGGLHKTVLYAILGCEHIRKLVYVSCNPESLITDLRVLLTPAKAARRPHVAPNKGITKRSAPHYYQHFTPVSASPVDMFPHTSHCEVVMLLERD